ncbi:hypothetical protein [Plebeiibacterium sediminum]|uniref:Uncharacterized protein n=1 Tax=Plebeiibacterium sediminum TaxID=2992112 RepID=A0AAE3SHI4_9BACT|nr:hypothetical protein [Plebeiobacterium sediminum]MCW3789628.1 hypothetical protein [Plebeiobacterium sediminum]
MHLFTVTIHTKLFCQKQKYEFLEKVAKQLFIQFKALMVKHELDKNVEYNVYWREGCVVDDIVIESKDPDLIKKYLKFQDKFKQTDDYKSLLDRLLLVKDEMCGEKIVVDKLSIEVLKVLISRVDFPSRGNRLDKLL